MIVSGAAALALMGTAAMSATDPVVVEKDGTGDYLLTPVYYAIGNWNTELKVVNTNTTRAVAAKVVVRDSKECEELFDFVIYLTPGDVWTGTLYEEDGKIYLKSTDDSMIIGGEVASPSNPIVVGGKPKVRTYQGKDPQSGNDKTYIRNVNWHGYVEIFGLASYNPTEVEKWYKTNKDTDYDPKWKECKPLDKLVFYKSIKDGENLRDINDTKDVANSDLMGKATVFAESSNINGKRFMSINMLALGNVTQKKQLTAIYKANTSLSSVVDDADRIAQMDAALAKDHIYVMYEGDGEKINPIRVHFTIPTKKYWFSDGSAMPSAYTYNNLINDPTNTDKIFNGEYYYKINADENTSVVFRDNKEHCNKCQNPEGEVSGFDTPDCSIKIYEEVHFFEDKTRTSLYDSSDPIKKYAYAEGGYIDFNLQGITYSGVFEDENVTFKGMPIVPSTFNAKKFGGDVYLHNWLYNQYHDANVTKDPRDNDLY